MKSVATPNLHLASPDPPEQLGVLGLARGAELRPKSSQRMYFAMHREGCSSAGQGVRALKAMTRSRVARPSSLWSRSEARLASISADHNDCDSDADPEGRGRKRAPQMARNLDNAVSQLADAVDRGCCAGSEEEADNRRVARSAFASWPQRPRCDGTAHKPHIRRRRPPDRSPAAARRGLPGNRRTRVIHPLG